MKGYFASLPYTASDCAVNRKLFSMSAGIRDSLTRSGALILSTFPGASICRTLSSKRKLRAGQEILPFSMSQTPSRVKPVNDSVCG